MFTHLVIAQAEPYQHVAVVMSIVLGLAVTQLLKGVAQLYRARNRARPYWLHSAWIAVLLVFSLLVWWTYWNYRGIEEWTFLRFVVYLSPMISFYYLTAIVIPDSSEPVTSLRDYYFASRAGFFGALALYGLLAGLSAVVVRGLPLTDPSNLFRVAVIAFSLVAMRSANERVHAAIVALCATLMLLFIFFFQPQLG